MKDIKQVDLLHLEKARCSGARHSPGHRLSFLRKHWPEVLVLFAIYFALGCFVDWIVCGVLVVYVAMIAWCASKEGT